MLELAVPVEYPGVEIANGHGMVLSRPLTNSLLRLQVGEGPLRLTTGSGRHRWPFSKSLLFLTKVRLQPSQNVAPCVSSCMHDMTYAHVCCLMCNIGVGKTKILMFMSCSSPLHIMSGYFTITLDNSVIVEGSNRLAYMYVYGG